MQLLRLQAINFRCFGSRESKSSLDMTFQPGLNVLVGENDGGKTAIIDAIRYVLATRAGEYIRCTDDDLHIAQDGTKADEFVLECTFGNLSKPEEARFVEWLEFHENGTSTLTLRTTCRIKDAAGRRRPRGPVLEQSTGRDGTGSALDADARDYLLSTYLKPLRDAESELSGGRYSRLSQILAAYPSIHEQAQTNESDLPDSALLKIFRDAEEKVNAAPILTSIQSNLNEHYLSKLSFPIDALSSCLGIGKKADLRHILDKLELWLTAPVASGERTRHGLGYNNILFMAAELLLLSAEGESMPLLLIEEPEAHLHPQLQIRLMNFLAKRCSSDKLPRVQAIVTTHSPNLACSAPVNTLTIVTGARTYALAHDQTKLSPADYEYLHRFLDATKSSMFFARGVLIVEGDAENILLPALAKAIGSPLDEFGIAIVNVGHRGLFRFANVFERADGTRMPIRVACLSDKDDRPIWAAKPIPAKIDSDEDEPATGDSESESTSEGVTSTPANEATSLADAPVSIPSNVQTFISPYWTFEYDLAMCGFAEEVYLAGREAVYREHKEQVDESKLMKLRKKWKDNWDIESAAATTREEKARLAFQRLHDDVASKAITAQCFAAMIQASSTREATTWRNELPSYIVEAIDFVTQPSPAPDQSVQSPE